jgi:hypothetical protein
LAPSDCLDLRSELSSFSRCSCVFSTQPGHATRLSS